MKRLFLTILCFLVMGSFVNADVTFYNSNEVTLSWDAVTTDVDNDAITGVTYRLYLANADTDPNKVNPVIAADDITDLSETITLGTKGRFFVGVQAVLDDLESVINWGNEIENQENVELFGLRFAVPPHAPKNIKK
jgi:hypothetical protein